MLYKKILLGILLGLQCDIWRARALPWLAKIDLSLPTTRSGKVDWTFTTSRRNGKRKRGEKSSLRDSEAESLIHENLFAKWKGALEKHKQKEKWVSIYFLLQEERASLSSPCSFSLTRFSSLYWSLLICLRASLLFFQSLICETVE